MSLPTRERGLKLHMLLHSRIQLFVAPYAGAWIEIKSMLNKNRFVMGRSLRGSVD